MSNLKNVRKAVITNEIHFTGVIRVYRHGSLAFLQLGRIYKWSAFGLHNAQRYQTYYEKKGVGDLETCIYERIMKPMTTTSNYPIDVGLENIERPDPTVQPVFKNTEVEVIIIEE